MGFQYFTRKPLQLLLEEMKGENRLRRVLGPVQLSSLGVGAIIGTGIFVLTGIAAHDKAGPALMLSFVIAGLACVFAAFCYAEFASMVPVAGSAYTYAYATLGELFAWIIGWDLVLEYTVASAAVAHGWSHYFQALLAFFGLKLPPAIARAPFDYDPALGQFFSNGSFFDLPAVIITLIITIILVKGIRESASFNVAMVVTKLVVVLFVIVVGAFYVDPKNWQPFAPYGYSGISFFGKTLFGQQGPGGEPLGMLAGAAVIFFAYIGFDSVSTHAEEARNPRKDVPIGIVSSLLICTVLYIAVSMILTGMVPYNQINIDAPVADAFRQVGLPWAQLLIAIGALAGITSVLLVMELSQPRVLLAMARDGLVPPAFFGAVHEKYRTPWKSTILTGAVIGLFAALLPLRILAELVNIGTLLAFVIVCAAVLVMRYTHPEAERPFRVPFSPYFPIMGILLCLVLMFSLPVENWLRLLIWLLIGFAIYFAYGRYHSVMAKRSRGETTS
ncbi:MAG TPA: amino acid permease [bacterium]|nr:amino acid permease [bacterium]HPR88433.1 amino acid permease [bacterium]